MKCKRPNVLIFCVDEMRGDHLGCMGNPVVRTPNLDALAGRGTLFRRAYCNNPICMPARATMFTGLLPRDHSLRLNGQSLRTDLPVLPALFKDAGYSTHSAGKLHLTAWMPNVATPEPDRFPECLNYWNNGDIREFPTPYYGFDSVDFVGGHTSFIFGPYVDWLRSNGIDPARLKPQKGLESPSGAPSCFKMDLPEEFHYNRWIADSTIRAIRKAADEKAPPFFAWCSFPDPHMPLAPPEPYYSMYKPEDVEAPIPPEDPPGRLPGFYRDVLEGRLRPNGINNTGVSEAHWREIIALTYGMITHVDAEIGRVIEALRETGQDKNTIVVFTGDHGDMMGDHGLLWKAFYTFEGCIHIPLIVAAPGMTQGQVTEALTAQIDLFPSLLDLCGIPEPGSEWPRIKTPFERGSVRPLTLRPGLSWRPVLEGKTDSLRRTVVIENDDPTTGLFARALVTKDYRLTVYPGTGEGELFDLKADPQERRNLWRECPDLRAMLTAELLDAYSLATPAWPVPSWNA